MPILKEDLDEAKLRFKKGHIHMRVKSADLEKMQELADFWTEGNLSKWLTYSGKRPANPSDFVEEKRSKSRRR